MADRFYTPKPPVPGDFVLEGAEAKHLGTVRRFEPGDPITLFCGDGCDYPATIVSVDKKSILLNVAPGIFRDRELTTSIVVASAVPKGERLDFLLEKLVELGVTRWIPLITTRSVVIPKEEKREKWQRAVIEASKQCGRNRLMEIESPRSWSQLLAARDLPASKVILHTSLEGETDSSGDSIIAAIGPEGGFTAEEVEAARVQGWKAVSLGKRILRVETAAIAWAARRR